MNDLIYRGIIIKQSNYGDAHRMLTIFTETDGIIKAVRYGIRGKKTSNAAAFQVFCYGDFHLRPSRGDIMTAVGADMIDAFYPVSEDIAKLSLISYLADITYALLGEMNPDSRILAMFLNAVYAAAYRNEMTDKIKAAYELKLMCAAGFMPDVGACGECGADAEYFSPDRGCMVCSLHRRAGDVAISADAAAVMKYLTVCPDKRMLAFNINNDACLSLLSDAAEKYVAAQSDREFNSLKYYKSMKKA